MADKNDEEYHYVETDDYEPFDEQAPSPLDADSYAETTPLAPESHLGRNVVIIIVSVILLFVIYKFLEHFYFKKPIAKSVVATAPTPIPAPIEPPAPAPLPMPAPAPISPGFSQKLARLELTQQNLQQDISGMQTQLASMNQNMNTIAANLAQLNATLSDLNTRLNNQSNEIEQLAIRLRPKAKPVEKSHVIKTPKLKYFIQAVIPGRAWLINTNGKTLTVRDGSIIHGLGTVKLIDPEGGKVVLNTGQVIRFSQNDS